MSTSYATNQAWGQQQPVYNQPQQNGQPFDFSALPTNMNGSQHPQDPQGQYAGYPPQMMRTDGQTSPDMLHPNYASQPQPRNDRRNGSFGTSHAPPNTFSGTYPSGSAQPANMDSYNAQYNNNPSPDQLAWSNQAAFGFNKPQQPSAPSFTPAGYDNTQFISSSPTAIQDTFPQSSQMTANNYTTSPNGRAKRPHESIDDEQEVPADPKEPAKAKPGACARCKNLKVKCEFKTETDPCKRCLNAGAECVIPGRKKRRTPPKREHLLNQIREQAEQIKELMAQLEASGQGVRRRRSSVTSDSLASASDLQSPLMSSDAYLDASSPIDDTESNRDIEAWIAKAKQSFQEFDSFIGVGGAGMPQRYIIDQDLENSNGSDEEEFFDVHDGTEEYEFAVEHHDEEGPASGQGSGQGSPGKLRHRSSVSSIHTNSTTGASAIHNRRKHSADNEKPAALPGEEAPFGLFGKLSLKTRGQSLGPDEEEEEEQQEQTGIAHSDFFKSSIPDPQAGDLVQNLPPAPLILQRKIITPREAEKLFDIFFEYMNLSVSLLDPVLYTAQRTCFRSPFLFTVICGIASRFYSEKPGLYSQIMPFAQQSAGAALISGPKTVDMVAAYILLSLYPVPAKRWVDQRNWLYLGLAIRTATDLNLHIPSTAKPVNENHAREMLNRTRIWMNCFNLDRSTGSLHGKPPIISPTDYIASNSENWWKSSPFNMKEFDIHLCAYNAELKVMAGFIGKIYGNPDHPTGLKKDVDFERIASETDEELKQLQAKWLTKLEDVTTAQGLFRTGLLKLAYPYARLVALSYGFQHAFGKNNTDENPFLNRCLAAAFDVVIPVLEDLCKPSQLVYIRHGPEAQVVFISFASAFLVKLLQPKFASWVSIDKRMQIRELVSRVAEMLSSPEVVVDDRHALKLYSKFLKNLLAAPMARVDPTSPALGGRKSRQLTTSSRGTPEPAGDPNQNTFFRSSASSGSMSPPARPSALSFNNFAPSGPLDPYAPENSLALTMDTNLFDDGQANMMTDFLQPPLPFDDAILHSMQSLSDPSGWQDTTMPTNLAWNSFQQSFDMDFRNHADTGVNYGDQFMTGV